MLQQLGDQVGAIVVFQPLKGAKAKVRLAKAHQHRGASRGRLIAAVQGFAGFYQAEGAGGGHPQGVEGFRGQHLAHTALEGEHAVTPSGVGGGARALGAKVVELAVGAPHLAVEKAPAIA